MINGLEDATSHRLRASRKGPAAAAFLTRWVMPSCRGAVLEEPRSPFQPPVACAQAFDSPPPPLWRLTA